MFKARLKNKETEEIIDCELSFTQFGNKVFSDSEGNKIDNSKYEEVPLDPYTLFGIECGKGWEQLYRPVLDYIEDYNKNKEEDEKIAILQIKEKWGRLVIYTNFTTNDLQYLIDAAENDSQYYCEECGSHVDAGMVVNGWMYTTCLDCLKKDVKRHGLSKLWYRNKDKKRYWVNSDGTLDLCQETEENK